MSLALGLDTGGTFTDAVLINEHQSIIAKAKALTTHANLIEGLQGAVGSVLSLAREASNLTEELAGEITLVSLSTTLATNSLVEGRGRKVCLVLIGYTPAQLARARLGDALAGDPHGFIAGGHGAGGEALVDLDLKALGELVQVTAESVDAYAVSSLFSVRNPDHELRAQALIMEMTGLPVSCGHNLSSALDAPRRALTALLNARLIPMIGDLLSAAEQLMKESGIDAPLMVVKGDGSLVSAEMARACPVETILSGPAASVVGAAFLSAETELLVSDMGGTTTDIALIEDGQPSLDVAGATVGGWRTMVEAIAINTYGLGGDSAIRFDRRQHGFTVGPGRVLPLCLLISRFPHLLDELKAQCELPMSTTHSSEFVLAHAAAGTVRPATLSSQQRELWQRIEAGPIAIPSLFKDQTLERALKRLEQQGIVIRAGFTPTDASHISNEHQRWNREASVLGARLLMRYSADNLGERYSSEIAFAAARTEQVSQLAALAMVDAVANGLTESQRSLIEAGFNGDARSHRLSLLPRLNVPVLGIGAPVGRYYRRSAELLGTEAHLPEHHEVANALGAVVGSIRQQHQIVITPGGGRRVILMSADGPRPMESLEEAATLATTMVSDLVRRAAEQAGAVDIVVQCARTDNVVEQGGEKVFFESRIVATATGRPGRASS